MTRPDRAPRCRPRRRCPRPESTRAEGPGRGPRRVTRGVVLEPGQGLERDRVRRPSPTADRSGCGGELTHRPAPRSLHGDDVEQAHARMGPTVGAGERPPDDLVAGTHGQDDGPGRPRRRPAPRRPAARPPGPGARPRPRRCSRCRPPAGRGASERARTSSTAMPRHTARPASTRPLPAVAVGAEQVGVHHHHPQGRRPDPGRARRGGAGAGPVAPRATSRHRRRRRHRHARRGRGGAATPAPGADRGAAIAGLGQTARRSWKAV